MTSIQKYFGKLHRKLNRFIAAFQHAKEEFRRALQTETKQRMEIPQVALPQLKQSNAKNTAEDNQVTTQKKSNLVNNRELPIPTIENNYQNSFEHRYEEKTTPHNHLKESFTISSELDTKLDHEIRKDFWAFLDSFLKVQNSPHTRRAYEKDLDEFLHYLEKNELPMSVHTLVEYKEMLATQSSRKTGAALSHVSVNRKMATIKSFLNWLVLNGVLPNNPARAVKSFRAGRESPTRDIPDDRVQKMLSLPARHRIAGRMHYAIMMVLFHLGLRRSELVDLRTSDLFEQDEMKVLRVRGKGDKERVLPVPESVHKSILTYLDMSKKDIHVDQPLFSPVKNNITKEKNKPLHPNAIAYVIKHYAKLAGVHYKVSPHSARATAVSNALDNQAPHRAVQHMAGWSSPLMVTRYDKRKQDLKNSAVRFINYAVVDNQKEK